MKAYVSPSSHLVPIADGNNWVQKKTGDKRRFFKLVKGDKSALIELTVKTKGDQEFSYFLQSDQEFSDVLSVVHCKISPKCNCSTIPFFPQS